MINKIIINKKIITLALTLALVTGSAIGVTPITGYAAEDEKITETAEKTEGSESETQEDHKYTYTELKTGSSADFYDGTDISDYEVVEIGSMEDLEALAANCILDEWSLNKNVKLTADIDLQGRSVTIPTFGGVFDGNGYAIKGLVYENETDTMGLFRYVRYGARVINLDLEGQIIAGDKAKNIGIIAGENYGIIQNCNVTGVAIGDENIGGIAGYNGASGIIDNCTCDCSVSGTHSTGGVAGSSDGLIVSCENKGKINTTVSDVTIELSNLSIEDITKLGETSSVAAFTDIGGICGLTAGKIEKCINRGTVGYEHVGYNVGGIAGRLSQGFISGCINYGTVYGRKDAGGIVGQMEPFMQIEYLVDGISELNYETNVLFDLVDETVTDATAYSDEAAVLLRGISNSLKQANNISLDLPSFDGTSAFDNIPSFEVPSFDIPTIDSIPTDEEEAKAALDEANKQAEAAKEQADAATQQAQAVIEATKDAAIAEAQKARQQMDAVRSTMQSLKENFDVIADYSGKFADLLVRENAELSADIKAVSAQARKVQNLSNGMSNNISAYEGVNIKDESEEAVKAPAEAETETAEGAESAEEGAAETAEAAEETPEKEGATEELNRNAGKLTGCTNYASVNADSGVGGIVGRIATEYDADPEDDINITGTQSLYLNASARAVVESSKNYGSIYAKKDYAGGVVGYAKYGYIISDMSFGDIESESGSFAGGIAGASESDISSCYSGGKISAKSNVGGITGKGNNISGCAAYCEISFEGNNAGSIAGEIGENGELSENYYVVSDLGGIDGVAYAAGAMPLEYDEFTALPDMPAELSNFEIIFLADGNEISRIEVKHGDSISEKDIPAIPEKEGYYGVWPSEGLDHITGNRVIEAVYEKWIGSVVSKEVSEGEDGKAPKPLVMAVGDFLPGAELLLEIKGDDKAEYDIMISYPEDALLARKLGYESYSGEVEIRALCDEPKEAAVEIYDGSTWKKAACEVIGSYVSFKMSAPGSFRIVRETDNRKIIIPVAAGGAVLLIVTGIILVSRIKKMKKKAALKNVPKAVIFDLDGTLIDTERFYHKVWPEAAEHFGYMMTDEQALQLRSLGRPFAPKKMKEWFGEDFNYDAVRAYRKRLFEQCVSNEGIKLKAGIKELLDFLKEKGVTIAVATATDTERTERYLKAAGVYEYFDKICSAADVKEGKPSPYVYIEACKQLGLMPEECLAVEDAPNGIKSAADAGCRVIFVPDQTQDEPEAEKLCMAKVQTADEIKQFFE